MAKKITTPADLLVEHSYIEKRVTWLEMHALNEPTVAANLVAHFHDIVEHLFRGSMQAHDGTAPFGHLAAHYWEAEHDDPAIQDDWEFHRKMRLMRERVGANRRVVDMLTGVYGTYEGGSPEEGPGWHSDGGRTKRITRAFTGPGKVHRLVVRYGNIFQPYMLPGDPPRYDSHFAFTYFRPRYTETIEGKEIEFSEQGPFVSEDGPSTEFQSRTAGTHQQITEFQESCDEAVDVGFFNEGFSKGGAIWARSRRWPLEKRGKFDYTTVSRPSPRLDGTHRGPFPGVVTPGGENTIPDDIFLWTDRLHGGNAAGGSLYPIVAGPIGSRILMSQSKIPAQIPFTDKSGIYGCGWYQAYDPNAFVPNVELDGLGMRAWFPADFLQSPGPPVDYDLTQEDTITYSPESGIPERSCVTAGTDLGINEDSENPLRTFEEALPLFEEAIKDPQFNVLIEFWAKHLSDFHRSGSSFNHGWVRSKSLEASEKTNTNPAGVKVEYLKRYGYCHLRGRLSFVDLSGSAQVIAWTLSDIPEAKSFTGYDTYVDHMCNSNIGLVRARLRNNARELVFPEYGFHFGLGSSSNLAWIDLDGISYPCV